MKKRLLPLGLLLLLVLSYSACRKGPKPLSREARIQNTIDERLRQYRVSHQDRCRKNIMSLAKKQVDSTMLANARNLKVVDTIQRPPKPVRPELPDVKTLEDTLEVAPLLPIDSSEGVNIKLRDPTKIHPASEIK